jgi:hypothetical protein
MKWQLLAIGKPSLACTRIGVAGGGAKTVEVLLAASRDAFHLSLVVLLEQIDQVHTVLESVPSRR